MGILCTFTVEGNAKIFSCSIKMCKSTHKIDSQEQNVAQKANISTVSVDSIRFSFVAAALFCSFPLPGTQENTCVYRALLTVGFKLFTVLLP